MALRNPELRRLRRRDVPTWWRDAKLGIFIHWTPASVPAFAPVDTDITALIRNGDPNALFESPYTEWYQNSLRREGSSASRHHAEHLAGRTYESFAREWEAGLASWDPEHWVERFSEAGARYVVLVTKHHDGYCLWPTSVRHPTKPNWASERDVVGELAAAVRARGMRFGVYYSGGLDWTFDDHPIGSFADLLLAVPGGDYVDYAEAHVRELIERYRPSVLWNDIAWPSDADRMYQLFLDYYEAVPDGVLNDRWIPHSLVLDAVRLKPVRAALNAAVRRQAGKDLGLVPPKPPFCDVRTPEYTVFEEIQRTPWECVRGMDHSFGYNEQSRPEHFLTRRELLWSVVDIAAKNGNLLLNVGPRGVDAQLPEPQVERLGYLAAWMAADGSVLADTRPWVRAGDATVEGADVRYVARGDTVWALVRGDGVHRVTLREVASTPSTAVTAAATDTPLEWADSSTGLAVELAAPLSPEVPSAIALRHVSAR